MRQSKKIGELGEGVAERFLMGKGYRLICRNWFCRYGEIDLVMKDGGQLVFIEVKARAGNRFGRIEESINSFKRKRFLLAAQSFLSFHEAVNFRIDAVLIDLDKSKKSAVVQHLKDVTL